MLVALSLSLSLSFSSSPSHRKFYRAQFCVCYITATEMNTACYRQIVQRGHRINVITKATLIDLIVNSRGQVAFNSILEQRQNGTNRTQNLNHARQTFIYTYIVIYIYIYITINAWHCFVLHCFAINYINII